jgi:surface antigen
MPHSAGPVVHAAAALLLVLLLPASALADPPEWAPAHGYRHHHQERYEEAAPPPPVLPWYRRGERSDYIRSGRCDRARLGAVIGGVVGGIAGSRLGEGDGRAAATIAGTVIGVLVGRAIGHEMDRTDEQCMGQVLEHVPDRESIRWQDPDQRADYEVTPVRTFRNQDGRYCREYTTRARVGGRVSQVVGQACRQPDGSWMKR